MRTARDSNYKTYQAQYNKNITGGTFPFACAYYFYTQNTQDIAMMDFDEFKVSLLEKSGTYRSEEESFKAISEPIYDQLDAYYEVQQLLDKNGKLLAIIN